MSTEPERRRPSAKGAPQPELPLENPADAWDQPLRPVKDLDDVARQYPGRKLSLGEKRKPMEFYGTPEQPNAFSMDSLEFFLVIAQFFREALPLRLILLMIACQKAGGRIPLTQEEMATVLDVARTKVNEALSEIMSHGIVFRVKRGVYQFNPPYSYRVAEFIPGTETMEPEYIKVDQHVTLKEIRADQSLPELVRFPSLEKMRQEIERLRKERAEERARRRQERAQLKEKGAEQ
ncbi:hypothetical protein OG949_40305 (plasmid) [Streptomyces scopuliridis]|uniref:hypothetical protein n=1 Tax=Streptomyces scopuliridis TaxID=452529 RepID=UPI002DD9B8BB|nr:hypothetical protein [Streptomyces scopuliridis]WSB39004.1 hypothetical protein OG949_40305 [Streptomyces scopuliridis]